VPTPQVREALARAAAATQDRDLQSLLPHGIGFHNGNLCHGDRQIVQDLFANSTLRLLMATSGLAVGVRH
jgi:replicative superfamily II helicase